MWPAHSFIAWAKGEEEVKEESLEEGDDINDLYSPVVTLQTGN